MKAGASGPRYRPAFGGNARIMAMLALLSFLSHVLNVVSAANPPPEAAFGSIQKRPSTLRYQTIQIF